VTNIGPTLGRNIGPMSCVTWEGEKAESLFVSPILEKTVKFSFEIFNTLQRKNAAGRLFHASTILTEKKYLRISK